VHSRALSRAPTHYDHVAVSPDLILVGLFESEAAGELCFSFSDSRTGVVATAKSYVSQPVTVRLSYVTREQRIFKADRDAEYFAKVSQSATQSGSQSAVQSVHQSVSPPSHIHPVSQPVSQSVCQSASPEWLGMISEWRLRVFCSSIRRVVILPLAAPVWVVFECACCLGVATSCLHSAQPSRRVGINRRWPPRCSKLSTRVRLVFVRATI
jgi:hypothetical protein